MRQEFAAHCEAVVRGDPEAAEQLHAAVLPYVRTIVRSALRSGRKSRPADADSDLRRRLRHAAKHLARTIEHGSASQDAIAGQLARWICDRMVSDLQAEGRRSLQDTVRRSSDSLAWLTSRASK